MTTSTTPRHRRGLLDTVLAVCLVYGVYAKTPLGAVAETAVRVARGQSNHPSWLSTFRGRETQVSTTAVAHLSTPAVTADAPLPKEVLAAALEHRVDAEALAAFISVSGGCGSQGCTVKAPAALARYVPGASGDVSMAVLAQGLAAASAAVAAGPAPRGTDLPLERAVESLFIGHDQVQRAVDLAVASQRNAPDDVESHAEYLPPSTRRGALQAALPVLYALRLRTLAWPAEPSWRISSPFGERIHPVTGERKHHNGTDIAVPTGTPLRASYRGKVKRESEDSISGQYIVLALGLGIEVTYCHLSVADVHDGEWVARAQRVALSGATGRITGPHLHYILRLHGQAVDAEKFGESPTARGELAPTPGLPVVPSPSPALPTTGAAP
jgi:murein DD-endopeptidase